MTGFIEVTALHYRSGGNDRQETTLLNIDQILKVVPAAKGSLVYLAGTWGLLTVAEPYDALRSRIYGAVEVAS